MNNLIVLVWLASKKLAIYKVLKTKLNCNITNIQWCSNLKFDCC